MALMHSRRLLVLAALAAPASFIGCSLVYTYGDVKQDETSDDEGGMPPGPDSSMTTSKDGGSDGPLQQQQPDAEAGTVKPQAGALVVSGVVKSEDGGYQYALSVLDPTSGTELSRTLGMAIVGIAYDGARDYWYLFEDKTPPEPTNLAPFPPAATDPVVLHVKTLDTNGGGWTTVADMNVPTLYAPNFIAPLVDRLAYLSFPAADAGTAGDASAQVVLTVIDTTTPGSPTIDTQDPLPFVPLAMTGAPPSLSGPGGDVTLLQNTASGFSTPGDFQTYTAKLTGANLTLNTAAATVLAPSQSSVETVGLGTYTKNGIVGLAAIPATADAGAAMIEYEPSTGAVTSSNIPSFTNLQARFQPIAISQCFGVAFVGEVFPGTDIFAVPLTGGGNAADFGIGNSISNVRFEPYTSTLFASFNGGGGFELYALSLGGTLSGGNDTAPSLNQRSALNQTLPWSPPQDLLPTLIEVKTPTSSSFRCPTTLPQ